MRCPTRSSDALLLIASTVLLFACERGGEPEGEGTPPPATTARSATELREAGLFEALPVAVDANETKVALGRQLYHDPGLSGDGSVSCASCHDIAAGGDDNRATSLGIDDQVGPINAPTVLNSSYNFVQFWDGRAATLAEQAAGPVTNPLEMGATWEQVIAYLQSQPAYVDAFTALYPDGITQANVTDAIAEFERTLVTPDAPFDQFLAGNDEALSDEARAGFELFVQTGCHTCHRGVVVGGEMYQRLGLVHDYFADRGNPTEADNGRFNVTHNETDRHVFKVPMLRNVELTGPYLHDGSRETLEETVVAMAYYQLGRELTPEQAALIAEFLRSLTGRLPTTGS